MKDYEIFISRNGITKKIKQRGFFFPANGEWDLEDYDVALNMLRRATVHFSEHRAHRRIELEKIKSEVFRKIQTDG